MRELEKLKERIRKGFSIKLSYKYTKSGAILSVLFAGIGAIFLRNKAVNNPHITQMSILLLGLIIFALLFFTFYQLVTVAEAELLGDKLKLKKVVGADYEINVNQVEKISSFGLRSTNYTIVKFKDNDGHPKRVLILNSNSRFFGRELLAGDIIKLAQEVNNEK